MHNDDKVNYGSPKPRRSIHSPSVVDTSGTSASIMAKIGKLKTRPGEIATPKFEKVAKKSLTKKNTPGRIKLESSNSIPSRIISNKSLTNNMNIKKDTPGDVLDDFSSSDSDTESLIAEDDDDPNEENFSPIFESSENKFTKSTLISPPKQEFSVNSNTNTSPQSPKSGVYTSPIFIIPLIIGIAASVSYWTSSDSPLNLPVEINRINISHEINLLPKSFPTQQEDTWKRFNIGIRNVETFVEPAIFFMVQWNEETQEKVTPNNIAFAIAEAAGTIAAKYLGKLNDTASPIVLTERDMKLTDHGALVSLYKEELEARHVMIIQNIEKVAGHIAQGLRYICDEYNPLVNRSAIFIILNADGCRGLTKNDIFKGSTDSLVAHSERCLTDLWGGENGLGPDILMPLLARIINIVIRIVPENESIPSLDG